MATNSNDLEFEKKYLADIERAKALSLETHELEKIRAKQRQMTPELASDPKAVTQTLEEYRAYLQRRVACGTSGTVPTSTNSLAPPASTSGPVRRHSDCRNPALQASTSSQPSQPGTQNGKDEADLISFNALPKPPDPKEEARNSLKELVEQMHRLNTQPHQNVPPAAQYEQGGFKTQRSLSMSAASFGFQQAVYQPVVGGPPPLQGPYNATSMQLVPYSQQASKPKPLTADELHRLYNSPPIYAVATTGGPAALVAPPSYPGLVAPVAAAAVPPAMYHGVPAYGTVPGVSYPSSVPPAPSLSLPQAQPYGGQPVQPTLYPMNGAAAGGGAPSPMVNPETALVHVPKLGAVGRSFSQPQHVIAAALNRQPSPARDASSVVLRPKSDPSALQQQQQQQQPRLGAKGTDLIDLGYEENSRVSVLEAFDPLLCGNHSSSGSSSGAADVDDKGKIAHKTSQLR